MTQTLEAVAAQMVRKPGGILAADESAGTDAKRLGDIGLAGTREDRLAWRRIMAGSQLTPAVNAIILPIDLLDDDALIASFTAKGVLVGVKIDGGLEKFTFRNAGGQKQASAVEEVTKGAYDEQLLVKLLDLYERGVRFTKARIFLHIRTDEGFPSSSCLNENLARLTWFARISQQAGMVPIFEPEVDMVGSHSLEDCQRVTSHVLHQGFGFLRRDGVNLRGLILKPNMVVSGSTAETRATSDEVAAATMVTLRGVPMSVPGVAFLSGGQSDDEVNSNLDAIAKRSRGSGGFELTFSFGRAAQNAARAAWQGREENIPAAREAFEAQLSRMSSARMGTLIPVEEPAPA